MSCCGSSGGNMPMNTGINECAPTNTMCCTLFKAMVDPCSQMLERNVRRNVYGQFNSCCPPPCPPSRAPYCEITTFQSSPAPFYQVNCTCPSMIVRPTRNNRYPPPQKAPVSNQNCRIACCNPMPPCSCCLEMKPCMAKCPCPCCPIFPSSKMSGLGQDPRCYTKPVMVSLTCPSSQYPMASEGNGNDANGYSSVQCPVIYSNDPCPENCPPKQPEVCMLTTVPMVPGLSEENGDGCE